MIVNRWFRKSKTFGWRGTKSQSEQLNEMRDKLREIMREDQQEQQEPPAPPSSMSWGCDANGSEVTS